MFKVSDSLLHCGFQNCQTGFQVAAQVHTQCPTSSLCQYLEVTASLCGFYDAEGIFLSRHRQFHRVVAGDLQKHSGIRTALVRLSGGVQKSRTKSQAGSDVLSCRELACRTACRLRSCSAFIWM